ncbi:MAG: ABC transporter ATP-binding protein [Chloroflexi bacterium]|nr:ABC transporter ATP-binding protein [Chloroflexota bacterium]MDA1146706.1 ABC transporter ATP-binding protein [Chloroflexota bacterium]
MTDAIPAAVRGPNATRDGSLITLAGVAKRYEVGPVTVTALAGVDLKVDEGEFVVVLGPSGCGKTTLLNMVGALDTPTAGTIVVGGQNITGASRKELFAFRRRTVSFIFQSFNLFPGLTARENVEFGIDASGRRARSEAADVLAEVGLGERIDHFPHQLSGGEQQRVAIARALATDNPVLLADEPTGELDFRTGAQILELLRAEAGPGRGVLVVTHNREISRVADRVIELSSGSIVSDGPPEGGRVPISELHW